MTSHDAGSYPSNRHYAPGTEDTLATASDETLSDNTHKLPNIAAVEPEVTSYGCRRRLALIALWEKMAE